MTNCKAPLSCDGLIFDMDGTLWDAVDSYVKIWNATIAECGISVARSGPMYPTMPHIRQNLLADRL